MGEDGQELPCVPWTLRNTRTTLVLQVATKKRGAEIWPFASALSTEGNHADSRRHSISPMPGRACRRRTSSSSNCVPLSGVASSGWTTSSWSLMDYPPQMGRLFWCPGMIRCSRCMPILDHRVRHATPNTDRSLELRSPDLGLQPPDADAGSNASRAASARAPRSIGRPPSVPALALRTQSIAPSDRSDRR